VLQALGRAADANPVGAAAHGPAGVAAGVWSAPDLYVARWTGKNRWVASYRFASRGRPDDYLREATGIPPSLSRDNWYGEVPDEVAERFLDVDVLLDEPPFPVRVVPEPAPPPARPAPRTPRADASSNASRPPAAPRAPRAPRRPPAPPKPKKAKPASKLCPSCNLQKDLVQFVDGSELCVDCR
jgi:hypothetical protein